CSIQKVGSDYTISIHRLASRKRPRFLPRPCTLENRGGRFHRCYDRAKAHLFSFRTFSRSWYARFSHPSLGLSLRAAARHWAPALGIQRASSIQDRHTSSFIPNSRALVIRPLFVGGQR